MDLLSHGFLPYGGFTLAGRPHRERVAAAVAGMAPDLDVLWAWASVLDPAAYPFQHRGFSHTVWGAPLLAILLLFLVSRPTLQNRWRGFHVFELGSRTFYAVLLGAWSHVLLDYTTITGVPAFWPLSTTRFSLGWYFFSLSYMMVVCFIFWVPVWRGRATRRWIVTGFFVLVGLLAVVGLVRYATYPSGLEGGETVTPGGLDWIWYVSQRNETGVLVYATEWGQPQEVRFYAEPNRTAARAAVEGCEGDPAFQGWVWKAWGLSVLNATRSDDGWRLTYFDSARLYQSDAAGGSLLGRLFGSEREKGFTCVVHDDGRVETIRPGGFFG